MRTQAMITLLVSAEALVTMAAPVVKPSADRILAQFQDLRIIRDRPQAAAGEGGVIMGLLWGLVVTALSLLAWGGQTLSWLAPATAARLGLTEAEGSMEPVYQADIRGEARFDAMTLWVLLVAGLLLVAGNDAWAYFGLVGGGMYVYFAGRGISTRREMQRREFRIGAAQNVTVGYAFLVLWGIVGIITIVAAAFALDPA